MHGDKDITALKCTKIAFGEENSFYTPVEGYIVCADAIIFSFPNTISIFIVIM